MRAIIADDHPLFRQALLLMLTQELKFEVDESYDYQSTLKLMEQNSDVDIIFLDLNMPDADGLSGLMLLKSQYPNTLISLVSAEQNQQIIQKALSLGVSGFIPKSLPLEQLKSAVEHIMQGNTWLPEGFETSREDSEHASYLRKLDLLTPHQLKVLHMMANGLLNKQIAYELGISESTVKQHASAVLKKLGLINRTQAGVVYKQIMQSEH